MTMDEFSEMSRLERAWALKLYKSVVEAVEYVDNLCYRTPEALGNREAFDAAIKAARKALEEAAYHARPINKESL